MSKDSEIIKRVTGMMKAGDKLVQDIKKDVGKVIVAANELKQLIDEARDKFKGPDDKEV
jgi:hypothetical protein